MAQAECARCHTLFLSEASFDTHRGINKKRAYGTANGEDDERQDLGRCRTPKEMTKEGLTNHQGKWGTETDVALALKMTRARNARGASPNDASTA